MKSNKIATSTFVVVMLLVSKFTNLSAFVCCALTVAGLFAFHEQSEFIKAGGFRD